MVMPIVKTRDDCIENSLSLTVPMRRKHAMPGRATRGSTRVIQGAEVMRGKGGQESLLWFSGEEISKTWKAS